MQPQYKVGDKVRYLPDGRVGVIYHYHNGYEYYSNKTHKMERKEGHFYAVRFDDSSVGYAAAEPMTNWERV